MDKTNKIVYSLTSLLGVSACLFGIKTTLEMFWVGLMVSTLGVMCIGISQALLWKKEA